MRLLLLSNSSTAGKPYLSHATDAFRTFFGAPGKQIAFVPYAGVARGNLTHDGYAASVQAAFDGLGHTVTSVHTVADPNALVAQADAVAVGGGNTFVLLHELYRTGLVDTIRQRVREGLPYLGWSAGANMACPTLMTTNDMPIIEPPSFDALGLVPFQINPHYTDAHPPGHQGETRAQRLDEFLAVNPKVTVVGLPEGTWLHRDGDALTLHGGKPLRLFRHGSAPVDLGTDDDLSSLLLATA